MILEKKIQWINIALIGIGIITSFIAIYKLDSGHSKTVISLCIFTLFTMFLGFYRVSLKEKLVYRKIEELDIRFKSQALRTPLVTYKQLEDFKTLEINFAKNRRLHKSEKKQVINYWFKLTRGERLPNAPEVTIENKLSFFNSENSGIRILSNLKHFKDAKIYYSFRIVCSDIKNTNNHLDTQYTVFDIDKIIDTIQESID